MRSISPERGMSFNCLIEVAGTKMLKIRYFLKSFSGMTSVFSTYLSRSLKVLNFIAFACTKMSVFFASLLTSYVFMTGSSFLSASNSFLTSSWCWFQYCFITTVSLDWVKGNFFTPRNTSSAIIKLEKSPLCEANAGALELNFLFPVSPPL